jgi:hypothetical protein
MRFFTLLSLAPAALAARIESQEVLSVEAEADADGRTEYPAAQWKALITGAECPSSTRLKTKSGGNGASIICKKEGGRRHFQFPAGKFDIDEQVPVPSDTCLAGYSNPNDSSEKRKKPDEKKQTFFVATHGMTDVHAPYCGTKGNLKQGDAQKMRVGFLMHSRTKVKNINYQGRDVTRPYDNGSLCGGAVFETPGCVSPGFGDGNGYEWLRGDESKRTGCYDHAGNPNNLLIGDGKGVEDVAIENVRLNDLFFPEHASLNDVLAAPASQIAVWVAQTQDGSATKNVHVKNLVAMVLRGDGINFHGNVQDSSVVDSHIESTGDDIYAVWGGYAKNSSGIVFKNNVGRNTGASRGPYSYGVCIAVYGSRDVTFTGTKCYDLRDWNRGQEPTGNGRCMHGPFCNSCMAYIHGNWFGTIYPSDNSIKLHDNEYLYEDDGSPIPESERPQIRNDKGSGDNIVTDAKVVTTQHTR